MSNIGIIGASGFLGSYAKDRLDAVALKGRFGWSKRYWQEVAERYDHLDTIVILARACREYEPRRDIFTITKEVAGLAKILRAFHNRRIIYASSKAVHVGSQTDIAPIAREDITKMIEVAARGHLRNRIVNLPTYTRKETLIIPEVAAETPYNIYAATKVCGESMVRCCKDYTIFRIWDITE